MCRYVAPDEKASSGTLDALSAPRISTPTPHGNVVATPRFGGGPQTTAPTEVEDRTRAPHQRHTTRRALPLPRAAPGQPGRLVPVGRGGLRPGRAEDKPIFLSVGYSACHWCHVMAHESFEDPAVAARLNDRFVSVKVDREERPDVDAVYMEAVQAITGRGGWPMSVFLTPDRRPFYGGTYFPPDRPTRAARRSPPCSTPSPTSGTTAARGRGAGRRAGRRHRERSIIVARPGAPSLLDALDGGGPPDLLTPAVDELTPAVRPGVGRVRRRAEVPPADAGRPRPPPGAAPGRAPRRHRAARWPPGPSTPWPPAASTTTSAAASPATPPTPSGWCPTSRRCSTTRPGCCGPTSTAGR